MEINGRTQLLARSKTNPPRMETRCTGAAPDKTKPPTAAHPACSGALACGAPCSGSKRTHRTTGTRSARRNKTNPPSSAERGAGCSILFHYLPFCTCGAGSDKTKPPRRSGGCLRQPDRLAHARGSLYAIVRERWLPCGNQDRLAHARSLAACQRPGLDVRHCVAPWTLALLLLQSRSGDLGNSS